MHRLIACLLLCSSASLPAQSFFADGFEARETKSGLGINLEAVVDFSAVYPFTDFFKQSRPWITASQTVFDTEDAEQLDLDADGWVQSLPACNAGDPQQFCIARTVINSAGAAYPSGRYLVLYDGEGTISYALGAQKVPAESTPGRDVIEVNGNSIWQLDITSTAAPPNHLRNIRVLAPGFDPAAAAVPTFHPDFLAELEPYRAIRFMDWMETNGGGFDGRPNAQQSFAQRPRAAQAHYSREGGVPLEVMIELANVSGSEPWFTLPHQVNDDYVTQFAGIVRDQLAAGRRVYVEYSNEVWNPAFPQGADIEERGNTLYGSLGDPFIRRLNAHGQRTAEICTLFKSAFGTEAARVTCVLGAQAANAFTQTEAADCPIAIQAGQRSTPCGEAIDAVAIAPYFANYTNVPANEAEIELWSLEQLFRELTDGGELAQNVATPCTDNGLAFTGRVVAGRCTVPALEEVTLWIDSHINAAQGRDLSVIAYEGGQHLVGVFGVQNNDAITELFTAANRDPRMGAIYQDYLADWKARGGELFAVFALSFSYGRFGSWGMIEQLNQQPRPPKATAVDTFNAENPCWWVGCEE